MPCYSKCSARGLLSPLSGVKKDLLPSTTSPTILPPPPPNAPPPVGMLCCAWILPSELVAVPGCSLPTPRLGLSGLFAASLGCAIFQRVPFLRPHLLSWCWGDGSDRQCRKMRHLSTGTSRQGSLLLQKGAVTPKAHAKKKRPPCLSLTQVMYLSTSHGSRQGSRCSLLAGVGGGRWGGGGRRKVFHPKPEQNGVTKISFDRKDIMLLSALGMGRLHQHHPECLLQREDQGLWGGAQDSALCQGLT